MQLTHIALWTNHLERLRDFYVKYFNGKSNDCLLYTSDAADE